MLAVLDRLGYSHVTVHGFRSTFATWAEETRKSPRIKTIAVPAPLRFDEAIVAGKKAQRQNPLYPEPYRCLASAFAHVGRDAEAREAATRLLEVDSAFTISSWVARGGQSNATLLAEGLRKAGLPE